MLRKITCNRTRKLIAIKEKVSLYSNKITFSYNQWLHLGSSQYKQSPQKKKKKKKRIEGVCAEEKEEGRMRRGKEEKEKERMKGKRRKGNR